MRLPSAEPLRPALARVKGLRLTQSLCGLALGGCEPDLSGALVGDHPPAVYFLFIDPALVVERTGYQGRLHNLDGGERLQLSIRNGRRSETAGILPE